MYVRCGDWAWLYACSSRRRRRLIICLSWFINIYVHMKRGAFSLRCARGVISGIGYAPSAVSLSRRSASSVCLARLTPMVYGASVGGTRRIEYLWDCSGECRCMLFLLLQSIVLLLSAVGLRTRKH